jgi:hypothetical protein
MGTNSKLGLTSEAERQAYAQFLTPELGPLPPQAIESLNRGVKAPELFSKPEDGHVIQGSRTATTEFKLPFVENGYAPTPGGGMIVACTHSPMRDVVPEMWSFWFAWHGNESAKYKLWHPQAHVSAAWADGAGYNAKYIGRTSQVMEYVGGKLMSLGIRFVPPAELGFDEAQLAAEGEVAICARVVQTGITGDLQLGTLCHHLTSTPDGAVMRSRFWVGGEYVRRYGQKSAGFLIRNIASLISRRDEDARALLVHCAEEMQHLARILPQLYAEYGEPQNA